jgi:hypothetical protein
MMVFLATSASAQTVGGSIAGLVRDASGAVLPGVTVEVASAALIEKVRTATTDADGRYRIPDLPSGVYTVTFGLTGFSNVKREGIQATAGFTATVNAEMVVGSIQETITVSGAAPLVDVQNTVQQTTYSRDTLNALPVGKNAGNVAALMPGAVQALANLDVGGTKSEAFAGFKAHDSGSNVLIRDGLQNLTPFGGANFMSSTNPVMLQEVVVQNVGGLTAEAPGSGPQSNTITRDGGNLFSGSFQADYGSKALQSNNLDDALRARNVTQAAQIKTLYDVAGGVGGPIKRDKVWFFAAARRWETASWVPGLYFNQRQLLHTLFYQPDLSRPAYDDVVYNQASGRATWQISPKNRLSATYSQESTCQCWRLASAGTAAPEALNDEHFRPYRTVFGRYTSTLSQRLVLDIAGNDIYNVVQRTDAGLGTLYDQPVINRSTGLLYGGPGGTMTQATASQTYLTVVTFNVNGSVSYVTGSHSIKIGEQFRRGSLDRKFVMNNGQTYVFLGSVPNQVTYWASPFHDTSIVAQGAVFAQDQWTLRKFTLNYGARFDYVNGSSPAVHMEAGPFVPTRDFPAVSGIPSWKDINPRVGLAYDVFGNGKTAVKVSLGRFVGITAALLANSTPANAMVTSATRNWSDVNGDYVPQATELGPLSDSGFGTLRSVTTYADDVLKGWNVQPYSWQGTVSLQHELRPGLAVNAAYFRTWYGNFRATDNLLAAPGDFDAFCVTAPADSRLPANVSGQQLCGNLAITSAAFGKVNNLVTQASHYGNQTEVHNGIDLTLRFRLQNGGLIQGGGSIGRTVTDNCDILKALPEMAASASPQRSCRVSPPIGFESQFKMAAIYPLKWAFRASADYQNIAGVPLAATLVATNAQILPSLGRNLAAGANATANIDLIPPNAIFDDGRINTLGFAVDRSFTAGTIKVQPRLELHNALNANTVLAINPTYGTAWQQVRGLVPPRVVKLAVRIDF